VRRVEILSCKFAPNKITFDKPNLPIRAGEEGAFVVTVKDDEAAKFTAEVADEKNKQFLLLSKPVRGEIKVTGLSGSRSAEPPSVILITVKSGNAIASFPVIYRRGIETFWDVLPPNIVGDNFGRTIKKDYYCIEVSINNDSASDLSLAGMGFKLKPSDERVSPNTSYTTVHGSLARRKLTHPRTLTLAAIDAAGSLMTGFNPFFHNLNHAKNFSQWIDIVSNPLAKGLDKVWKDSYVDEMARLESDNVLHDDKVIPKNSVLKVKIFFPKKALFANKDPKRDDMAKVREELGQLYIIGYRFDRGNLVRF
jgi:hypothetical protein